MIYNILNMVIREGFFDKMKYVIFGSGGEFRENLGRRYKMGIRITEMILV